MASKSPMLALVCAFQSDCCGGSILNKPTTCVKDSLPLNPQHVCVNSPNVISKWPKRSHSHSMVNHNRSETTLNYQVLVERYPFLNGVVACLIPVVNLLFTWQGWKTIIFFFKKVGSQEPNHCKVGTKPHHAPRGFLSMVGPTCSNSRQIARSWLFICLFNHDMLITYFPHEWHMYQDIVETP